MRNKVILGAILLGFSITTAFGGDTPAPEKPLPFPTPEEVKTENIPSEEELGGEFVFDWPVLEPLITSGFGKRRDPVSKKKKKKVRLHAGLDLEGDPGDLIMATGPGKVLYAGWNSGYGNYVLIQHANGFRSHYGHMSEILVYRGQMVRQDAPIGLVGSTGHSTGPHLHFGITKDGTWVNPSKLLGTNSATGEKDKTAEQKDQ
jgi:murein DD-endopeptidase MepM/ murein hydrolase activator NlpD